MNISMKNINKRLFDEIMVLAPSLLYLNVGDEIKNTVHGRDEFMGAYSENAHLKIENKTKGQMIVHLILRLSGCSHGAFWEAYKYEIRFKVHCLCKTAVTISGDDGPMPPDMKEDHHAFNVLLKRHKLNQRHTITFGNE